MNPLRMLLCLPPKMSQLDSRSSESQQSMSKYGEQGEIRAAVLDLVLRVRSVLLPVMVSRLAELKMLPPSQVIAPAGRVEDVVVVYKHPSNNDNK